MRSPTSRPFRRGRFAELPETPRRPHRFFDVPERRVVVPSSAFGRVGIHYRELGEGAPLLLVHGLMTTSYSWRYVIEPLARDHRVVAIDLPGCGRSDKPAGARYGGPELAAFLVELVDALGVRGGRVVGNSMGGYLCMRAALADGGAFGQLVNIHSPGVPDWRYRALGTLLAAPGVAAALAWWVRRAPQRWAHRNVHYFDETLKSLEEAAEYGDLLASADGARAFVGYLKDAFAPRDIAAFTAGLAARRDQQQPFPVPLLLLYARQDPLVPPSVGERLHALVPDAPLRWLDSTSHFAHVDTPDAVVDELRAFFGGAQRDRVA
ncbi:MAG TPA: alpha/beta hydrolase [Ideonella sp.]|nr:alpha/beta hydrolase [Ideonella sp.]